MRRHKRTLLEEITSRLPQMARAAQDAIDAHDWDSGFGACDSVASALAGVIVSEVEGVEVEDGGQDGDDHAYPILYRGTECYGIDIHPSYYETGNGYNWERDDNGPITPAMIEWWPIRLHDILGEEEAEKRIQQGA